MKLNTVFSASMIAAPHIFAVTPVYAEYSGEAIRIGVTHMWSMYVHIDGAGSVQATRMAIADRRTQLL